MKRILLIFTCLTLLISLVACGSSDKNLCRTNENVTKVAKKVVEILDGYLNLTLSLDEANASLSDMQERMETMDGVDYTEYEYSDPNYIVLYKIGLCIPIRSWDTDSEIESMRDIIAFNAGIPLLKESHAQSPYEPFDFIENSEKKIMNDVGVIGLPASSCIVTEGDDYIVIYVSFDAMYGVTISEFCNYVFDIFERATSLYDKKITIHFDFLEYENRVVDGEMHESGEECTGRLYVDNLEEDPVTFHEKSELEKEAQRIWKNR